MKPTKAIILAAGRGTRMGVLTQTLPKPMVHVHNKPVLEHILCGLRDQADIKDFFIVTSYLAEVIEDYFGDGSKWNIRCVYGRQSVPDGTGKAPELARDWVGKDSFFLSYGDILIHSQDYADMLTAAGRNSEDGIISVKAGENVALGGAVLFDKDFYLKEILEKGGPRSPASPWYNAGIYILKAVLFKYTAQLKLSSRNEYELPDALCAMAQDGLQLKGYEIKNRWADVRDPGVLEALNQGNRWT